MRGLMVHRLTAVAAAGMFGMLLLPWSTRSVNLALGRAIGSMFTMHHGPAGGGPSYGPPTVLRGFETGDAGVLSLAIMALLGAMHLYLGLRERPTRARVTLLGLGAGLLPVAGLCVLDLPILDRVVTHWPTHGFWGGLLVLFSLHCGLLTGELVAWLRDRRR